MQCDDTPTRISHKFIGGIAYDLFNAYAHLIKREVTDGRAIIEMNIHYSTDWDTACIAVLTKDGKVRIFDNLRECNKRIIDHLDDPATTYIGADYDLIDSVGAFVRDEGATGKYVVLTIALDTVESELADHVEDEPIAGEFVMSLIPNNVTRGHLPYLRICPYTGQYTYGALSQGADGTMHLASTSMSGKISLTPVGAKNELVDVVYTNDVLVCIGMKYIVVVDPDGNTQYVARHPLMEDCRLYPCHIDGTTAIFAEKHDYQKMLMIFTWKYREQKIQRFDLVETIMDPDKYDMISYPNGYASAFTNRHKQ